MILANHKPETMEKEKRQKYIVRWRLGNNEQSAQNTTMTLINIEKLNATEIYESILDTITIYENVDKQNIDVLCVSKL